MARKKATPVEEEPMKEEVPFEETEKWNEPSGGMISQDTVGHLMKAATEFLGAMDTMMPKKKVPNEVTDTLQGGQEGNAADGPCNIGREDR